MTGLTLRGRCLTAAGAGSILAGIVIGSHDLVRIGVFVLALPLLALWLVHRSRYRLACERRLEPARVPAGSTCRVVISVNNVSRLPTGMLLAEDTVPHGLGTPARFVLDRVPSQARLEVAYQLNAAVRGRYVLGPLAVTMADPFGLVRLTRAFRATSVLVVTPVLVPVPPVRLGGAWVGGGDAAARSVASAGDEDVAPREYRDGDDLRRVHWRSTAKYGELMVRREEQPWQSRASLVLDTRATAYRGSGAGSSFEWAVSAAASLGVQLQRAGFGVRLVGDLGGESAALAAQASTNPAGFSADLLLEALALVVARPDARLEPVFSQLRRSPDGLLVALLGAVSPAEAERLARLRMGSMTAVAVILDPTGWGAASGPSRDAARETLTAATARLQSGGWRVIPVAAGESLTTLWPLAAIRAAASHRGELVR